MKPKKSKRANLENYRTIFFQIGIIITLSAILFAFEWKSAVKLEKLSDNGISWTDIEDLPPVTRPEPDKKEIKPELPSETFIIEKNDVEIEDEPSFLDLEDEWDTPPIKFGRREEVVDEKEYTNAQFMPTFREQEAAYFRNFIAEVIKFPEQARELGISGKVFVSFVIDKDGSVINVEILRGVDPLIDSAVIEAIKSSPKWEPGMQEGRFVKVRYSMAITFELQ
ncbi:energy transducer TonB [Bacteroidota bacterium]